jgi:predicted nucleotidyltransferase
MSTVLGLVEKGLAFPPKWLVHNIHYETIMGSVAYGVSSDTSDMDLYGFCIPPKEMAFPQLLGEIPGFDEAENGLKPKFQQWQEHHIVDPSALGGAGRSHDVQIFSIVKYFHLCMENNPNMIDSLFTPVNCVLHQTRLAGIVREKRRLFLHRGCWHTFKGYAYSQLHKMTTKDPQGKRKELRAQYGFDVKFAYHIVRLMNECEQILTEGDLDLQRTNEQLKAIRRGDWTEEQIRDWFTRKEKDMEHLYHESALPWGPDKKAVRTLLMECMEEHYGSLDKVVANPDRAAQALREIAAVVERYRDVL